MPGQQCVGVGVDCVQFVAAVLDELHGLPVQPVPRYAHDMALNNPIMAARVARYLASRYPNTTEPGDLLEPGDVVVCALTANSGPGHVMIVGPDENTAWHSVESIGVTITSVASMVEVWNVWRSKDKVKWQHS